MTFIFSVLASLAFCFFIEAAARIALYIKTGKPSFLYYDLPKKSENDVSNRFVPVLDGKGNEIYYTCVRSTQINPVNSLGFRGPAQRL